MNTSERILFQVADFAGNHNGGTIAFATDRGPVAGP